MLREKAEEGVFKAQSTDAQRRGGPTCSSDEGSVMAPERRGQVVCEGIRQPERGGTNDAEAEAV